MMDSSSQNSAALKGPSRRVPKISAREKAAWLKRVKADVFAAFGKKPLRKKGASKKGSVSGVSAKKAGEKAKKGAYCADCGKDYSRFGLDLTLSNSQWETIAGAPDVLLCANCICLRAAEIKGGVAVRACIEIAGGGR